MTADLLNHHLEYKKHGCLPIHEKKNVLNISTALGRNSTVLYLQENIAQQIPLTWTRHPFHFTSHAILNFPIDNFENASQQTADDKELRNRKAERKRKITLLLSLLFNNQGKHRADRFSSPTYCTWRHYIHLLIHFSCEKRTVSYAFQYRWLKY